LILWGRVLTGGRELPPSRVEISAGSITAIEPSERPLHADISVQHGWIAPGLVDLQVNGAGGVDLSSAADPNAALEHVARTLARHGVTSFCPTLVSSPVELIVERLAAFAPRKIDGGADSLGPHIEGPFIDPEHRGVHDPRCIRLASGREIERWLRAGRPRIVTLAPELPGALDAVVKFMAAGCVVSLGHSGADVPAARAALDAGASMGTHLFNAMPPLHHRQPGLVGALLASHATLGLITDGVHLDPLTVDLVVGRAGVCRVALVSDALAAAGSPDGPSVLGDQAVVSDGRAVRRSDGVLAGSSTLLEGCLKTACAWLPWLSTAEVVRMATQTPADALGLQRKGRVAAGADADLVVLDAELRVRRTLVAGEIVL
jgi:N-acetylglucosamine-6-phosphate deacetylase